MLWHIYLHLISEKRMQKQKEEHVGETDTAPKQKSGTERQCMFLLPICYYSVLIWCSDFEKGSKVPVYGPIRTQNFATLWFHLWKSWILLVILVNAAINKMQRRKYHELYHIFIHSMISRMTRRWPSLLRTWTQTQSCTQWTCIVSSHTGSSWQVSCIWTVITHSFRNRWPSTSSITPKVGSMAQLL